MQALSRSGWDIDLWRDLTIERIRTALFEDRPVILVLPLSKGGRYDSGHSVVACGIDPDCLTVTDPTIGDFVRISISEIRELLAVVRTCFRISGGMIEAESLRS